MNSFHSRFTEFVQPCHSKDGLGEADGKLHGGHLSTKGYLHGCCNNSLKK